MAIIRSLFWFAVFIAATFSFTVIFEHGFKDFPDNAKKEYGILKKMFTSKVQRAPDASDSLPH
jgi:hypothetical protein